MVRIPFFPLIDALDHEILMHKEAHFQGHFPLMLEYYEEEENRGVFADYSIWRIKELYQIEQQSGYNLSETLLLDEEKKLISQSLAKYQEIKALYDLSDPLLHDLADLILAEQEPKKALQNLIAQKEAAFPHLIRLISTEELFDPLFPGFGKSPIRAAYCLGRMGNPQAITPLFEALKDREFLIEEALIDALVFLGKPAKEFLLKILQGLPPTDLNERALIALLKFRKDPAIGKASLKLLSIVDPLDTPIFVEFLVLGCYHLDQEDYSAFAALLKRTDFLPEHRQEMEHLLQEWGLFTPKKKKPR